MLNTVKYASIFAMRLLAMAVLLALVFVVLVNSLFPMLASNLAMIYLQDLSMPLPLTQGVGTTTRMVHKSSYELALQSLAWLPRSSGSDTQMLWTATRIARQLEVNGDSSRGVICGWNPDLCQPVGDNLRLSADGHLRIAMAYTAGRVIGNTVLEKELVALSCLTMVMRPAWIRVGEACLSRAAKDWPKMILAPNILAGRYSIVTDSVDLYVARDVSELNKANSVYLENLLTEEPLSCQGAIDFLRRWIALGGFSEDQTEGIRMTLDHCPGTVELWYIYAKASELAGFSVQARNYYEKAGESLNAHQEAYFGWVDFLARSGECTRAVAKAQEYVRLWPDVGNGLYLSLALTECRDKLAVLRDSYPSIQSVKPCVGYQIEYQAKDLSAHNQGVPVDNIVSDPAASDSLARRSEQSGMAVAYGPYINLPYGKYRISFFIKAEGVALTQKVALIDVRADAVDWRSMFWRREIMGAEVTGSSYDRFSYGFVHTGEGAVSVAVISLSDNPVSVDRVVFEDVSCQQ